MSVCENFVTKSFEISFSAANSLAFPDHRATLSLNFVLEPGMD
jgi:hypothetical protein